MLHFPELCLRRSYSRNFVKSFKWSSYLPCGPAKHRGEREVCFTAPGFRAHFLQVVGKCPENRRLASSWVVISEVISRENCNYILQSGTYITPLITTHEPPSGRNVLGFRV